jgi:hypothetical protein
MSVTIAVNFNGRDIDHTVEITEIVTMEGDALVINARAAREALRDCFASVDAALLSIVQRSER